MFHDLFTNVTITVAFLFISGQILRLKSIEDSPIKGKVVIGVIFGVLGILLMIFTIKVTDIVIIDTRNLAVICGGIFGGPVAALITSAFIGIFRVLNFGINEASIIAFLVAVVVGLGTAYISATSLTFLKKFSYMFFLVMLVSNLALIYLLFNVPNLMEILKYYWTIYVFGAVLSYHACKYIIENNRTFKEMSYYQIMADNLSDMITLHNLSWIYKYVSPSSKQLLGNRPNELIGNDPFNFIHPNDISKIREILEDITNNKINEYTQHLRMKKSDGQNIWVESTFKSIKDNEGNCKEIICATRDISERKKNEDELREQREEAIKANQLKSQFLANMSHELRTPLNSIIGFTTRVKKKSKGSLSKMQEENLEIVRVEAHHLLSLINDLLDYSRLEAGKMNISVETFDLESVINEAYSMTENLILDKDIHFSKVIKEKINLELKSDRVKVKQIIVNLLSNAFKYSENGSVILNVDRLNHFFKIVIEDQGVGISKEHLENIFNEFYQVDGSFTRKVGGAGLGLAITKKIVEILGGQIQVESKVDKGSCFSVYLPTDYYKEDELKELEVAQLKLPITDTPLNGDRIVAFIEGDVSTKRLYDQYLTEEGFTPVAINEKQSVDKMIERIVELKPIAIILDIILQTNDGWAILNKLKNNYKTKKIPLIICSVLNEEKKAYRLHADEYLVKPIMQDDLVLAIKQNINHSDSPEILVADDDENFVNLVGQYLNDSNIPYITASDGKKTIEMIKKYKPNLIILDLMMPVLNGFEVLDWLRSNKNYQDATVVVVSSKDLTTEEKEMLLHSASLLIHKSGVQIEDVIEEVLEKIRRR